MTIDYELPKGRRIKVDFDENGITKVTVQALDSLIGELNYYADKVCDLEQIRNEIADLDMRFDAKVKILEIIDKYTEGAEK